MAAHKGSERKPCVPSVEDVKNGIACGQQQRCPWSCYCSGAKNLPRAIFALEALREKGIDTDFHVEKTHPLLDSCTDLLLLLLLLPLLLRVEGSDLSSKQATSSSIKGGTGNKRSFPLLALMHARATSSRLQKHWKGGRVKVNERMSGGVNVRGMEW
mmetsp:Transcript_29208/g.62099  ORF Transcript_29208/g.62099 Transcript_29208/m.62099 type:complete len:157 (+) Transcript_29208:53-523(+)